MTKEQIAILINDEDIFLETSKAYWGSRQMYLTDPETKICYVASDKITALIKSLLGYYSKEYILELHSNFKQNLTNKASLESPLHEDLLLFYKDQLLAQKKELIDNIAEVDETKTVDELAFLCLLVVLEKGFDLIGTLKFRILKSNIIESFSFGNKGVVRSPNFRLLDDFFLTADLKKLYTIAAIAENISYLRKLLLIHSDNASTKRKTSRQTTHRQQAIVYIFKSWADVDQFPPLKRIEARRISNGFHDALDDLEYFEPKKKNSFERKAPYKPMKLEDLNTIAFNKLLSADPKAEKRLLDDILKLKNKS